MGGPKSEPGRDDYGITWAALAGAIGVGIGGARWLLNYVDKEILQKAVVKVAGKPSDQQAQIQIMEANPTEAFQIAADMPLDGDQEGSDDVEVPVVTNLGE
ncbi:hypothetical protein [Streptomyces sp. NPDC005303]|uniref:hypothetical protein n=1 Tax=Streptomyces sp. NPDC005303 TaxID=3155713 RepID=UPI0033BF6ACC